jgi:signal peptidase I
MLFSLIRAEGHSMEPEIKNGSFFICSSIPYLFFKPKVGDTIIFKNNRKIIVKKIYKIEYRKIFTKGVNEKDSKDFPAIGRKEILGKIIWKL